MTSLEQRQEQAVRALCTELQFSTMVTLLTCYSGHRYSWINSIVFRFIK